MLSRCYFSGLFIIHPVIIWRRRLHFVHGLSLFSIGLSMYVLAMTPWQSYRIIIFASYKRPDSFALLNPPFLVAVLLYLYAESDLVPPQQRKTASCMLPDK